MEVRIVTASTLIHVLFSDANWGKMIVSIDINLRQLSFLKMFLVTIYVERERERERERESNIIATGNIAKS